MNLSTITHLAYKEIQTLDIGEKKKQRQRQKQRQKQKQKQKQKKKKNLSHQASDSKCGKLGWESFSYPSLPFHINCLLSNVCVNVCVCKSRESK